MNVILNLQKRCTSLWERYQWKTLFVVDVSVDWASRRKLTDQNTWFTEGNSAECTLSEKCEVTGMTRLGKGNSAEFTSSEKCEVTGMWQRSFSSLPPQKSAKSQVWLDLPKVTQQSLPPSEKCEVTGMTRPGNGNSAVYLLRKVQSHRYDSTCQR